VQGVSNNAASTDCHIAVPQCKRDGSGVEHSISHIGRKQIALKKILSLQGIAILCSEKSCTSSIREASLGQIMINIGWHQPRPTCHLQVQWWIRIVQVPQTTSQRREPWQSCCRRGYGHLHAYTCVNTRKFNGQYGSDALCPCNNTYYRQWDLFKLTTALRDEISEVSMQQLTRWQIFTRIQAQELHNTHNKITKIIGKVSREKDAARCSESGQNHPWWSVWTSACAFLKIAERCRAHIWALKGSSAWNLLVRPIWSYGVELLKLYLWCGSQTHSTMLLASLVGKGAIKLSFSPQRTRVFGGACLCESVQACLLGCWPQARHSHSWRHSQVWPVLRLSYVPQDVKR